MHKENIQKYYFINKFCKTNIDKQKKGTIVIYRNYNEINLKEILNLREYCKHKKLKFILSNNFKLALKLNLNGAYIPSFNHNKRHLSYSYKKNFIVMGSAHNINEIRIKEIQKVNYIVLSSLFKKNKNYLGLNKFRNLSKHSKKNIIALGGISKKNLTKLNMLEIKGFAGISYFEN